MIFVTSRPAGSGTIAYASACAIDGKGRATHGNINFAPAKVRTVMVVVMYSSMIVSQDLRRCWVLLFMN